MSGRGQRGGRRGSRYSPGSTRSPHTPAPGISSSSEVSPAQDEQPIDEDYQDEAATDEPLDEQHTDDAQDELPQTPAGDAAQPSGTSEPPATSPIDIIVDKAKIAAEEAQRDYAATLQAKANIEESRGENDSAANAEKTLLHNNAMDKTSEIHGSAAQQASDTLQAKYNMILQENERFEIAVATEISRREAVTKLTTAAASASTRAAMIASWSTLPTPDHKPAMPPNSPWTLKQKNIGARHPSMYNMGAAASFTEDQRHDFMLRHQQETLAKQQAEASAAANSMKEAAPFVTHDPAMPPYPDQGQQPS
jgi:hypothetical protein